MSEIKLLPCPFCGGEAKTKSLYRVGIETIKVYWIECSKCRFKHKEWRTEEEAIKKWNTRKPMQDIVERLEEELVTSVPEDKLETRAKYWNAGLGRAKVIVKEVGGMND